MSKTEQISDVKKNKIEWVSRYEVTDNCCNPMAYGLKHGLVAVRAHKPGETQPSISTPNDSSWYPFHFCPWCGTEL